MLRKLFFSSLLGFTFIISSFFTPMAFAQSSANITSGPLSQYRFKAAASWMAGTINLTYYNDGSADKFAVLYGSKSGNYKFGALNLPATPNAVNKFAVNLLGNDRRYYFILIAQKNGQFVYMTDPVSAISN